MRVDLAGRRELRAAKRRIREALEPRGIFLGLSDERASELIERIWFIDQMQRHHDQFASGEKRAERFFTRGPGQLRRLRTRLDQLRTALNGVEQHIATICGNEDTPSGSPYLAAVLRAQGLPQRVGEIAALVRDIQPPNDTVFDEAFDPGPSVQPPQEWVTRTLAAYLISKCGISKNDATRRIARIENTLWSGNLQDSDPDSRSQNRSEAIRKRLQRRP